jgi:hypothetical protein
MKLKQQFWISLAWIGLCLFRLSTTWKETSWFLFRVEEHHPSDLPPIDPHDIWLASHGTWWFFLLLASSLFFVHAAYRLLRTRPSIELRSEAH